MQCVGAYMDTKKALAFLGIVVYLVMQSTVGAKTPVVSELARDVPHLEALGFASESALITNGARARLLSYRSDMFSGEPPGKI